MTGHQSKALVRRKLDPRFVDRWFVGSGIDVGSGKDPLVIEDWPNVTELRLYDKIYGDQDAQFLSDVEDESYDFAHSSFLLGYLQNPKGALVNWLRVLKTGGFLACLCAEELLFEQGKWPSQFEPGHRSSFTLRSTQLLETSKNLVHLLWQLRCDVELVSLLTTGWEVGKLGQDQSGGRAECAVEFVVRKPNLKKPW